MFLTVISLTWNPYPECRSLAFSFREQTNLSVTSVCNGFTDAKPKTGALDVVVQFHESVEHLPLIFL